jgi:hypothetical protein
MRPLLPCLALALLAGLGACRPEIQLPAPTVEMPSPTIPSTLLQANACATLPSQPWVCQWPTSENPTPTATDTPKPSPLGNPYAKVIVASGPTATQSAPQPCPSADAAAGTAQLLEVLATPSSGYMPPVEVLEPYLDYLNAGGDPNRLPSVLQPERGLDLTGDGVPELLVRYSGVFVFGCSQGKYLALLDRADPVGFTYPQIEIIADANKNGIPELVVGAYPGTFADYEVIEWDGLAFRNLLAPAPSPELPFVPSTEGKWFSCQFCEPSFADIDADTQYELVFTSNPGGSPRDPAMFAFPWRGQTDIFEWDGTMYVPYESRRSAPEYRFQAVQDGDRQTLFGDHVAARSSYNQAISDESLAWWSEGKYLTNQLAAESLWSQAPTPTMLAPDADEFPSLASYASYRLSIIQLLDGHKDEALATLAEMSERYPDGVSGSIYANLASVFMQSYQASGDLGAACAQAVAYAREQGGPVLYYLGSQHHGPQATIYLPEYLCPFGVLIPDPLAP